ncbi:exopolysaccharide biosynthesis polyprenyl glycosylphosphotransferase [Thermoleophilia bacterium SCSIO 60948]|nr:exopolysaccharide biosynthesis polyprenyl glycosylphosphotransferase [Thermoleophilia bacterium SCSIO 60948]
MNTDVEPALQMGGAGTRRLGALRAQRTLGWVGLELAPALTAGLIALSHVPVGLAVGLTVVMLGCATTFERQRYPLHLMRLSGYVARLAVPLAGVLLTAFASLAFEPIQVTELGVPLLGAWVVTFATLWVLRSIGRDLELRVVVVGSSGVATALKRELETAGLTSHRIVGWIDFRETGEEELPDGCLGNYRETREIVLSESADLVIFALRESGSEAIGVSSIEVMESVAQQLLGTDVRLIGANQAYEDLFGHVPLATMNAAWFQYVLHPRFNAGSSKQRRLLDLTAAGSMLLIGAPIIAIAAICIKLTDRGPVFYRQLRVGERGEEFWMLKLRSMRVDAESDGVAQWSRPDDDRITAVGGFLRRTHLDELPQLINVLRGQMSLVGPRPERRTFVDALEQQLPYYDRRHLMRPGITGWAQVRIGYAGTDRGTAWKLSHDLYYFKHRSVGLDLLIMIETLVTPVSDLRAQAYAPDETFIVEAQREHV